MVLGESGEDPTCKSYEGSNSFSGWSVGFSVKVNWMNNGDGVGSKWGWFWTSVGMSFGSHL